MFEFELRLGYMSRCQGRNRVTVSVTVEFGFEFKVQLGISTRG